MNGANTKATSPPKSPAAAWPLKSRSEGARLPTTAAPIAAGITNSQRTSGDRFSSQDMAIDRILSLSLNFGSGLSDARRYHAAMTSRSSHGRYFEGHTHLAADFGAIHR